MKKSALDVESDIGSANPGNMKSVPMMLEITTGFLWWKKTRVIESNIRILSSDGPEKPTTPTCGNT